jgi:TM2 domain-containing membrane protein YozV
MNYYILQGDDTKGPFTIGQLRTMWGSGNITGNTLHCREGDKEWKPLRSILNELEPSQKPPPLSAIPSQPGVVVVRQSKSRGVYIILALFFGLAGIHNFYAGYFKRGAMQLLCTVLLGWIIIGLIITFVWVLSDMLTVSQDANGDKMT